MTNSQELALSGWNELNDKFHRIFRNLLLLTIILFFFIYLPPARETLNPSLSRENLLYLVNEDRLKNGLGPLRPSLKLEEAALQKARDILRNNYFAHTSPSGLEPWDFIKATGFPYLYAGENLALNYQSAYELENDFLKSVSHRENLLSPLFSEVGIAVVKGQYQGQNAIITVQMFASPAERLSSNY